jgi:hypothetical protein
LQQHFGLIAMQQIRGDAKKFQEKAFLLRIETSLQNKSVEKDFLPSESFSRPPSETACSESVSRPFICDPFFATKTVKIAELNLT